MKKTAAFTIMEMLIVIVLLAIITGTAVSFLGNGLTAHFQATDISTSQGVSRVALDRIALELRDINPNDIQKNSTALLSFSDSSGVTITYTIAGTTLTRQQGTSPPQVLLDNLAVANGLSFTYLNRDGVTYATSRNQIYYILIRINQHFTFADGTDMDEAIHTTVYTRNSA